MADQDRDQVAKNFQGLFLNEIDGGEVVGRPIRRDRVDPNYSPRRIAYFQALLSIVRPRPRTRLPLVMVRLPPLRPRPDISNLRTIDNFSIINLRLASTIVVAFLSPITCDAKEKFGPGDLFLLGAGGALFPGPGVLPFRFLLLLAGLWDSKIQ